MRSNTPSDLASPARHSLAHRKSRRRPSGRFIAFPGEVSSRFHGLFRLPFALPRFARAPAIFTARRRRFFLRPRLPVLSSGARRDILATSDTSLSPPLGSHNIPLAYSPIFRFVPLLSFLSSCFPSFLPSLLPSVASIPLQRMSFRDLSPSRRADLFLPCPSR